MTVQGYNSLEFHSWRICYKLPYQTMFSFICRVLTYKNLSRLLAAFTSVQMASKFLAQRYLRWWSWNQISNEAFFVEILYMKTAFSVSLLARSDLSAYAVTISFTSSPVKEFPEYGSSPGKGSAEVQSLSIIVSKASKFLSSKAFTLSYVPFKSLSMTFCASICCTTSICKNKQTSLDS